MTRNIVTVPIQKVEGASSAPFQDLLAVEEPLEIRVGGRSISITMRTPGRDCELAAGFLFTEGVIQNRAQILDLRQQDRNVVAVTLDAEIDTTHLERRSYTTSACGVCGKASIEALRMDGCPALPRDTPVFPSALIHQLPEILRDAQPVFERTGGLHAAALFDSTGKLLSLREDVGRHNALDKLIGAEFLAGRLPLHDRLMLVSSRASFELIQKTVRAGIPILAAVGAPSSLAVETARRFDMTLLGFVRDQRFNIYSGDWRILA